MNDEQLIMEEGYHQKLRRLMDEYAHSIYAVTRKFPREEMYGTVSQLRRATLSIILNYIEGYSRERDKVHKNFLEISLGSLKESKYLVEFCHKENFINNEEYLLLIKKVGEIGAMLLGTLRNL